MELGVTIITLSANEERRREKGRSLKEERREAVSSLNCSQTLTEASYRENRANLSQLQWINET